MNARVKVCTRSSYTCRVTRGCHRIESNHARQSSRSVRTPRVSMRVIDQVYFIRFDSRVGWFHASSRRRRARASSREIHSSFSHSSIHAHVPRRPRRRRRRRPGMHPCLGRLRNIYFFHPRRRSSSSSPTSWTRTNEPRLCVVESRLFPPDAPTVDHISAASVVFARSSDATRVLSHPNVEGVFFGFSLVGSVFPVVHRCDRGVRWKKTKRFVCHGSDGWWFFFCVCVDVIKKN